MQQQFLLGQKTIGQGHKPYIIAEMSGNHNQSLDRALALVDAAAAAGVDALKIQTYTADTMTIRSERPEFTLNDPSGLWQGQTLYSLYQQAYTPWEWHGAIFQRCQHHGIAGFSTPFDETAVDFLEGLNVPFYKIASFENTHHPLLAKVASTGKPVIMSTGMASISELHEAVTCLRDNGCQQLVLLKCTSTYPTSPENTHIRTLPHMRDLFGCLVGLSDHTMGVGVAVASVALGAQVIEKHFTLNRAEGGVDAAFSLEPSELKQLVAESERAWLALGDINYGGAKNEEKMRLYRRSFYAVENIAAGQKITSSNTRIIRPGLGLAPKHAPQVFGRTACVDIAQGTPLAWHHLQPQQA